MLRELLAWNKLLSCSQLSFVPQVEIMLTLGHRANQKAVPSEEGKCFFSLDQNRKVCFSSALQLTALSLSLTKSRFYARLVRVREERRGQRNRELHRKSGLQFAPEFPEAKKR